MVETILRANRNKKHPLFFTLLIIVVAAFLFLSSLSIMYILPFFQQVEINPSNNVQIYYMGSKINNQTAIINEDKLYIPLAFIKENIDPSIEWDEKEKTTIITTEEDVFHFPLGKKEGLLNLEPYSFIYPVIEHESNIYLPFDPLNKYYDIDMKYNEEDSIVIIHDLNQPIQQGLIIKETKLREKPTIKSSWLHEVSINQSINIMKEVDGWYWIENSDGLMGYINKENVKLAQIKTNEITKDVYQPWNPIGKPIVLTWEYASRVTVDPNKINNLSGVQVVSPTWFHLQEGGLVNNNADIKYVEWAHQNGYQVWGLFSNSFDLDLTHDMLSNSNLRIKVIKQLLSYVDLYQLDGINLDFENVLLEDKDALVQFVEELTPLLHEKDRTVSIDVTFKSNSENWSMFYDRSRLGEIVDYVIVMGYDEHWSSSPVAGSVASIPWVEKGIQNILEEVPSEKLILGVPFYTRLWTEEKDENGVLNVSSKALTMEQTQNWIDEHQADVQIDELSGQRYVEVVEDDITYKIWIEDSFSMQKRIEIMKKYRLAGLAAWRRGFESKDFWSIMTDLISQRP